MHLLLFLMGYIMGFQTSYTQHIPWYVFVPQFYFSRSASFSISLVSTCDKQVLIGIISSLFILAVVPLYGLAGVWTGLYLFMTLRVVAGIWR